MFVEENIQELFKDEIVGKHENLVQVIPERLLALSQEGNEFIRTHYAYHPRVFSPLLTSLDHFQERTALGINTPQTDPINGFFIQSDESIDVLDSKRYIEIHIGQSQQLPLTLSKETYFSFYFILNQRQLDFSFDRHGNLINFSFILFRRNKKAYRFDLNPVRDENDLKNINQMTSLNIHDPRYDYLFSPTPNSLTISRSQNGKLLDQIGVHRPNVTNTRIMEAIIHPRLLEDPLNDDPEMDYWRKENWFPLIVTESEQYPES